LSGLWAERNLILFYSVDDSRVLWTARPGGIAVTIGSLLEGGFRIVRERGGALLIWTIIQLAGTVASSFAIAALLRRNLDSLMNGVSADSAQSSYTLQAALVGLAGLAIGTVFYAAAQRVVLRPMEGGPGWLKLGMDEVRLFLLMLLYIVGFVIMVFVLALIAGIFFGWSEDALSIALVVLGFVVAASFGTRVSLTFPLTLKRQAFAVTDGWKLTKGHFWTLFVTFFIIFLMLLAVSVLTTVATEPGYVSAIARYGFLSPEAEQASMAQYGRLMAGTVDAPIVINWVLIAIQGVIGYALIGGAAATAVQQLTGAEEGLSETFS
jgi:hypothetical protein